MARSVIGRLRGRLANRRAEPRHEARLPLSVAGAGPGAQREQAVKGYTCDLSASGLGLVIPSARPGDQRLAGPTLRVSLLLEKRRIHVQAAPVRHAPLGPGGGKGESGQLIGARIVGIGESDRALLAQHLKRLRYRVREYAP